MIVIDSSYALACLMPDERRPETMEHVLSEPLLAPFIWPLELASAIRNALRRKRFNVGEARALADVVSTFETRLAPPDPDDARRHIESSMRHDLTPYDALYIELCLRQRVPLATRDRELMRAAGQAGIRTWS